MCSSVEHPRDVSCRVSKFFSRDALPVRRRRVGADTRLRHLVLRVDRFESRLSELRTIDVPPPTTTRTKLNIVPAAAVAANPLPRLVQ